jgi:cell division protein FtsW
MARTLRSDKVLFWATLVLVCTSVVMVFSAMSTPKASLFQMLRQLAWAVAGVAALLAAMRLDYHQLRRPVVIWSVLGIAVAGLLAVFFFNPRNGANRWIDLKFATLQPSELAKLAAIFFAAAILERRMHRINDVGYALAPIAVVTGGLAFLVVIEPDLGTAAVIVLVVVTMLFAAGMSWRYLAAGFMLMLPLLTYLILAFPWRFARILAFLNPSDATLPENYQLIQSKIALGSGGAVGLGLGNSQQKLFFLPEPQTDFIFAVIGEELGLIGTTAIVICFVVIAWRGLRAALLAPDRFGTFVGIGIAMLVGVQALINMSVVTGLAPTKGIPLPLVSAGGSSLFVTMLAMGILLNISQQASSTAAASVSAR